MKRKDIAFVLLVLAGSANAQSAPNSAGSTEPATQKPVQNLDARIQSLQSTKDCIKNANTREAVASCRGTIKLRPAAEKVNVPAD